MYDTLDDPIKPTKGWTFSFAQEFAGLGGSLKYLRTQGSLGYYHPLFWETTVGSINLQTGYITGYDGQTIPIQERFFKGGDTFRGFAQAGVGPRDTIVAGNRGAVGGNVYAIGSAQLRLPSFLPDSYGVNLALFTDFGTVGHLDTVVPACSITSCIKDNLAMRASAGLAIAWKSPFGPITIDLGVPFLKTSYDKSQILYFSAGTGL